MASPSFSRDYFNSKQSSALELDERDLLDSLPPSPKAKDEMNRICDALNYLSPADSPVKFKRLSGGGYFSNGGKGTESTSATTSSLSTPSLESDYSSLSNSCSPLSTPLDVAEYRSQPPPPRLDLSAGQDSPSDEFVGIAQRRQIKLPKLEIPPFQLDASYFAPKPPSNAPPARPKPSTFQWDVSPPRRSKTAYSTSLPSASITAPPPPPSAAQSTAQPSRSWNPEPIDLAGIIGERPGSPIRLRKQRRDNGFAF